MNPNIDIDIQHHITHPDCPSDDLIVQWATTALALRDEASEISIALVDTDEMTALNETYRHKTGPTNVLAFPFEKPDDIDLPLLGDLVICIPKMIEEAHTQHKPLEAHFAHLTIHGCLHLLGYDHEDAKSAAVMEQLEIDLLKKLNFPNPYQGRHS
jgi:probable rRNA maturation factor